MAKWIGVIFLSLAGLGALLPGGYYVISQAIAMASFAPTPATVVGSQVMTSRGSKGSTNYNPFVQYVYRVAGSDYTSSRVVACSFNTFGYDSSTRIVRANPPGASVTCYVNPADPNDAFLVRSTEFLPYLLTLSGFTMCAIAVGMLFQPASTPAPTPVGPWWRLAPVSPLIASRNAWTGGLIVATLGLGAGAHYLITCEPEIELGAYFALPAYAAGWVLVAIKAARRWSLTRRVHDAMVVIDQHPVRRGTTLNMKLILPVHAPMASVAIGCELSCVKRHTTGSGKSRSTKTTKELTLPIPPQALDAPRIDQPPQREIAFGIPADAQATQPGNPNWKWELTVKAELPGAPDYKGQFEIEVV
jgi:hypothetical protein